MMKVAVLLVMLAALFALTLAVSDNVNSNTEIMASESPVMIELDAAPQKPGQSRAARDLLAAGKRAEKKSNTSAQRLNKKNARAMKGKKLTQKSGKSARRGGKSARRNKNKKSLAQKKQSGKRAAKKYQKKLNWLQSGVAKGNKKAYRQLKKLNRKLRNKLQSLPKAARGRLQKVKNQVKDASKKYKMKRKLAKKYNKGVAKRRRTEKAAKTKKSKSALKRKIRRAKNKRTIRKLKGRMTNLKQTLNKLQAKLATGVRGPGRQGPLGRLRGIPAKKLVNGYAKKQDKSNDYLGVADDYLPTTYTDDMSVQQISTETKQLSKFTHEMARKDDISLV